MLAGRLRRDMKLTRRGFGQLTGVVTVGLLAGCLGNTGGGEDGETETPLPDGGDGDTGGTRPSGTGGPGVSLVGLDDAPDGPLQPDVTVVEAVATEDHPPMLRTSLTNTGDEAVVVGEGRAIRFQFVADDSRTLTLLPAEGDYPVVEGNCWRLEEPIATTMEYRTEELGAGETIEAEIELYALSEYDGCLPVGEFRFETGYSIAGEESEEEFTWGFSVVLE